MANRLKEPAAVDITATCLVKGDERYIFVYEENNKAELLRTFGRFASNKDLSFSWYDAALMSQRVRGK